MEKKQQSIWIANYAGILAILCSFVIGSLVLVNVGVHVYKNIVENNAENFSLRASLSYVATKVRQCDKADSISITEEEGVPILVLREELQSGTYRTMIYCYKGKLRELFQEEGMEYKLADGLEVTDLTEFQVKHLKNNRLQFVANNGEEQENLVLSLRSTQKSLQ